MRVALPSCTCAPTWLCLKPHVCACARVLGRHFCPCGDVHHTKHGCGILNLSSLRAQRQRQLLTNPPCGTQHGGRGGHVGSQLRGN